MNHIMYFVFVSGFTILLCIDQISHKYENLLPLYCNVFRKFYVSGKLPTYPSPKPTLTLSSYLGQNVGLGEG